MAGGVRIYVGIDDTDNLESRGTGYRARGLAAAVAGEGLGRVLGVTRHQLFVSPEIPYTSHNSAACLVVQAHAGDAEGSLIALCRDFLARESAAGSDAGFCVGAATAAASAAREFGARAKREVVTAAEAGRLAGACGYHLEGVTGDRGGVIGAFAAVGLRAGGEDGRFIWVRGLREMAGRTLPVAELLATTGVEVVETREGAAVAAAGASIALGEWPRPLLRSHRAALVVEECRDIPDTDWRVVARDYLKRF